MDRRIEQDAPNIAVSVNLPGFRCEKSVRFSREVVDADNFYAEIANAVGVIGRSLATEYRTGQHG